MTRIRRWVVKHGVRMFLRLAAGLCRSNGPMGEKLMDALGRLVAWRRRVQPSTDPTQLGQTWQRAFPSKKQVPITHVKGRTAFGEIHTPCPLRGTKDEKACYRMMAYDRSFMAQAGALFEVLESQATPGVTVCKVAIHAANFENKGQ